MEGWYRVTEEQVREHGGQVLERHYSKSLSKALEVIYPEHEWLGWKFPKRHRGYWNDVTKHKKFFLWLKDELGLEGLEGFYSLTAQDIAKHGGSGLLEKYHCSSVRALAHIFPDHNWHHWKFARVPQGFWVKEASQRAFLRWLAKKANIKDLNDWYRVSTTDLRRLAPSLITYSGGLGRMLPKAYPHHKWDIEKLSDPNRAPKSSQWLLKLEVEKLFPHTSTPLSWLV